MNIFMRFLARWFKKPPEEIVVPVSEPTLYECYWYVAAARQEKIQAEEVGRGCSPSKHSPISAETFEDLEAAVFIEDMLPKLTECLRRGYGELLKSGWVEEYKNRLPETIDWKPGQFFNLFS